MLTLIIGRAGTGKTAYVMNEIKQKVESRENGMLLIVPEQYSHYAERQLCEVCGDALSLYAETVSFSRLCINVLAETGNAGIRSLDGTGQILAMYKALELVSHNLKICGKEKRTRPETLKKFLEAVKEFKNFNISVNDLKLAANKTANPLKDKLYDLALIYDTFNGLLLEHGGDVADRISLLAERIMESTVGGENRHVYIDGFNDFTAQEMSVIEELLKKKTNITVCLTCDPEDDNDIFKIPQKTITQLLHLSEKQRDGVISSSAEAFNPLGLKEAFNPLELKELKNSSVILSFPDEIENNASKENNDYNKESNRSIELNFLEKHLFSEEQASKELPVFKGKNEAITIYSAPSRYVECEYAAYEILKLVRSGYRWRDIGVMARDWEDYSSLCENVFERYEIPFFTSGKSDILLKPPITLIDSALEIAAWGLEYKTVFKYLKTGLAGISVEECAILENYAIKWQIRGNSWIKEWKLPPHGYSRQKDTDEILLERINDIRKRVVEPLQKLRDGFIGETSPEKKLRELYSFLKEIKLPEKLMEKVKTFTDNGDLRLADEYTQLWEIITNVMEHTHAILKNDSLNAALFHKLFILALSQSSVGVIPVSIDRTALGGMAMSRRRDLKCLILMGATDESIPKINKNSGALSENERLKLKDLIDLLPAGLDECLHREMNMLYSTLTQPSEKLIIMYPMHENQRPSFIINRLHNMFNATPKVVDQDKYMVLAKIPYEELQKNKRNQQDLSKGIFLRQNGILSRPAAELLYGKTLSLSATRVGSYYSCPYGFFLKYGLKLEPRSIAEYDGLAAGNFIHDILEKIILQLKENDGFININEEQCLKIANDYIKEYEKTALLNFNDNENKRLEYLFRRYSKNVEYIVRDTINELNNSMFKPLDPELDMKELSNTLIGKIDRVDGYDHDGKQYIRVIDYKTHANAYSLNLTDVLYGRNLQMLMYLFALEKYGHIIYKNEVIPAGVLYVPTRDVIIKVKRDKKDDLETIERSRINDMRRSGFILNDPEIIDAMENGDVKRFLPKMEEKEGIYTGDCILSSEQFKLLSNHVGDMVHTAEDNILNGNIDCTPYYNGEQDNGCKYCDYQSVCGFDEENGDRRHITFKKKPDEIWKILKEKAENNSNNQSGLCQTEQ